MIAMATYYVPKTALGADIPAQQRKLGTPAYGFKTIARALAYTPPGGFVEERHTDGRDDWGGRIVATRARASMDGEGAP